MKRKLAEFLDDESGATAVEYSVIVALVSIAGIGAMTLMGDSLISIFTWVGTLMNNASA